MKHAVVGAAVLLLPLCGATWHPGIRTLRFISPPNGSTLFRGELDPHVEIVLDSDLTADAARTIQRHVDLCFSLDGKALDCRALDADQPLQCVRNVPPGSHTLSVRAVARAGAPEGAVQTNGEDIDIVVVSAGESWTAHHHAGGRTARRGPGAVRMVAARASPLARYAPEGAEQARAAVLTLWTVLDGLMLRNGDPETSWSPFGYMRPVQLDFILNLIARESRGDRAWSTARKRAITVCEVGLNGGHSAAAFLTADPRVVVHSFDIGANAHTAAAVELLRAVFPHRFAYHEGPSSATVPAFALRLAAGTATLGGGRCDIVFIDGSHHETDVKADIDAMRTAAACPHLVIFDDTATSGLHVGPARAIARAVGEGILAVDRTWTYPMGTHIDNPPVRLVDKDRKLQPCGEDPTLSVGWGWSVAHFAGSCEESVPISIAFDDVAGVGTERITFRFDDEEAHAAQYSVDSGVVYV
tara:strand:- start:1 stop:1413 length:1413 start_codon:yes stop_codon:yes gene_type:complete